MRVRAKSQVHDHVLDEFDNAHLSFGVEYVVVGFDDEYFRVIDDAREPILYPHHLFDVSDPYVPDDWVRREEDGGYHVDPPECTAPGFYEDYFDGKPDAIVVFERVVDRLLNSKMTL